MNITLSLDKGMRMLGTNERGMQTAFDSNDGDHVAADASPMEIMLEAMGACSAMDVLSIIRKKRKTITDLRIEISGTRADDHPKVYVKAHLIYTLVSPDATTQDLTHAINLSHEKYCSASAMFIRSGCDVTFEAIVLSPTI